MNREHAQFSALCVQIIHRFSDGLNDRPHADDNLLGIRRAGIDKRLVGAACQRADFVHILDDSACNRFIIGIRRFFCLEEDIRVLCRTARDRVVRRKSSCSESGQRLAIDKLRKIVVIKDFDLLDLVRRTKAVKEMEERDAALDSGQMRDRGEVHGILHRCRGEQSKAGLSRRHHVTVIAKDRQGMSSQSAGRHVEHARQQLACYFVHVRHHQEQALRCRVRCGQRTARK